MTLRLLDPDNNKPPMLLREDFRRSPAMRKVRIIEDADVIYSFRPKNTEQAHFEYNDLSWQDFFHEKNSSSKQHDDALEILTIHQNICGEKSNFSFEKKYQDKEPKVSAGIFGTAQISIFGILLVGNLMTDRVLINPVIATVAIALGIFFTAMQFVSKS